jgi:hypothetical protein
MNAVALSDVKLRRYSRQYINVSSSWSAGDSLLGRPERFFCCSLCLSTVSIRSNVSRLTPVSRLNCPGDNSSTSSYLMLYLSSYILFRKRSTI